MPKRSKENHVAFLLLVGLLGWFVPGAGYALLKETKRAIIIFVTITITFGAGLYIGSIGVIDMVGLTPWYVKFTQLMNSPMVAVLGRLTAAGGYYAYGRPNDIGQIYVTTAGLLNLLSIVNAVYLAHQRTAQPKET